jgi:YidC/Oxa1 family membrane protein insertase
VDTILGPLYDGVSWIIVQFHKLYSMPFGEDSGWAWGLSIVSLVVVIRICLIPLFVKQIKATRNMQVLQPKMKAIQERYKNDKQRQSEEMMKLYRESGTNPLSSCFPILAQSPFFIALFQVLHHIADGRKVGVIQSMDMVNSARDAQIFGAPIAAKFLDSASKIADLHASQGTVRIVTVVMIVLMSSSQFYTQRQLMMKNVDLTVKTPFMQQQKMLMYVFPFMFAIFGINFPVGVLVYWLTTNLWTFGQQMYVIKRNPTPGSLAWQHRQEKLRAAGKIVDSPEEVEAKEKVAEARAQRSQPKRQSKSRRQSGAAQQKTRQATAEPEDAEPEDESADAGPKEDAGPEDGRPGGGKQKQKQAQGGGAKQSANQAGGQNRSRASGNPRSGAGGNKGSGKRKGGQQGRPRHPSSKK